MIPKSNKTKNIIIEPTPAKITKEPEKPVDEPVCNFQSTIELDIQDAPETSPDAKEEASEVTEDSKNEETPDVPVEVIETKDEVVVPDVPEIVGLFSVKTDTYNAWVIRNSETSYKANLVLAQGSAYDWDASTHEEAESILQYHIVNMKL